MGAYVNEYDILIALKAVLDANGSLSTLLRKKPGDSKVILGVERPQHSNLPVVQLSIMTKTIEYERKMNELTVRAAYFAEALPTEEEDVELLSNIGERIYDLFDDTKPSIGGYLVHEFFAESGENIARDYVEPENRSNHFQSLTFRMFIKRRA